MWHRRNFLARMFPLKKRCDGLVDRACTILSQFVRFQNYLLFFVIKKLDCFAQFYFQNEVLRTIDNVAPSFESNEIFPGIP